MRILTDLNNDLRRDSVVGWSVFLPLMYDLL